MTADDGGRLSSLAKYVPGFLTASDDRPRWLDDLRLILLATAVVYLTFILLGLIGGLSINGITRELQAVTLLSASIALVVLALNLHWGYTGLFNIGIAGFMAVGAYTTAMVTASPDARIPGLGLSLWIGIPAGMIAAALVGFIVALPALRLRADYFAIVTLAAAEVIRRLYNSSSLDQFELFGIALGTGSGRGIRDFPNIRNTVSRHILYADPGGPSDPYPWGQLLFTIGEEFDLIAFVIERIVYTLFIIVLVILVFVLLTRTANSPFGRILKAIREDELATKSLGKNTNRVKIKAFMLGCAIMGLAGIVWQGSRGNVTPDLFMPIITFYIFIALIIGGSGSNAGGVVGAVLFAGLLFDGPPMVERAVNNLVDLPRTNTMNDALIGLANLDPEVFFGYVMVQMSSLRFMLFGIVLILLMIYRPDGVLGHRNEPAAAIDLRKQQAPDHEETNEVDETDE